MDRYQETFKTWNNMASLYEERFMHLDIYNETYDFICNAVSKKEACLLDVGCGPGNIMKYLLTKRPDFRIHGIDMAPNMIELAKKNNPAASFEVMDGRDISKLPSLYDAIIGGFCMPYFSEAESKQFIRDSYDLLNSDGLIYLSFMEGTPADSGYKTGMGGERVYFYYHDLDVIKNCLAQTGFRELRLWRVEYGKPETKMDIHTIVTAFK